MKARFEGAIAARPVLATLAFAALVAVVDVGLDVVVLGEFSPLRTLFFVVLFTALFVLGLNNEGYVDWF